MTLSGDTPPRRRREGWCELRLENCGLDKWGACGAGQKQGSNRSFFRAVTLLPHESGYYSSSSTMTQSSTLATSRRRARVDQRAPRSAPTLNSP